MGNAIQLNESNFDAFIADAKLPVVIDFWAPWCGPCRALSPVIDELAVETAGKFQVAKVNVDEAPAIAAKFTIRSIPCLIFFKGGVKVEQVAGAQSKAAILQKLESL